MGDSKIVDSTVLSEIVTDKKYSKELTKTLTYIQRVQFGVRIW